MLIQFGQDLGEYLYDVFVAKFDFWLVRSGRSVAVHRALLVQWISSERAGQAWCRWRSGSSPWAAALTDLITASPSASR